MNDRLSCRLCGEQPCHCVEAECRACDGEGKVVRPGWTPPYNPVAESPADPPMVECEDCEGTGSIKCDGPRKDGRCKFASPPGVLATPHHCYCEEAWERQQEDMASEPPPTARERQLAAQAERDALRGSR